MDTNHEVLSYELQVGMPLQFKDAGTHLHGLPCNHMAITHPMHTANWNGATAHQPSLGPAKADLKVSVEYLWLSSSKHIISSSCKLGRAGLVAFVRKQVW